MSFNDNLITGGAALLGSIIGGLVTLLGAKFTRSAEYRLKKEEILREKADDRIKFLYRPLLKLMSPSPPYDDFYLESEVCKDVINLIEKNELYTSPDLLKLFREFRYAYCNGTGESNRASNIDSDLYEKAYSEYEDLKNILGYGLIIKESSASKSRLKKIWSCLWSNVNRMKR
ncbi:MAG: hypothetical protein A2Z25_07090 [Planctomycetes bacterium RBG_16_55_9]|nr:MAG: hypothetical protein A2Z25_07090 [Planctomycetes bacterium RBG_16_55_9]